MKYKVTHCVPMLKKRTYSIEADSLQKAVAALEEAVAKRTDNSLLPRIRRVSGADTLGIDTTMPEFFEIKLDAELIDKSQLVS